MQQLRESLGWSQAELARRAKIGQSTVNRLEAGQTRTPRLVYAVADVLQTTVDYLLGRTDDPGIAMFRGSPAQLQEYAEMVTADPDLVAIDSLEMSYGLGGTFVDVEPGAMEIEKAKFSRAWLRKFTHSPPELLFTTSGIGDSMRPTIEDADIVIVDRSERLQDTMGEKLWAIVFGGVGMIKRLRPMPDGTVKLMSDNQSVRDELATDNDLHIVGRVVAVVRRH